MKSINIEQLRENLHSNSAFKFTYTKKDGTERKAVGTLNDALIPIDHQVTEDPSTGNVNTPANFRYYDLEKSGWRSLSKDIKEVKI